MGDGERLGGGGGRGVARLCVCVWVRACVNARQGWGGGVGGGEGGKVKYIMRNILKNVFQMLLITANK